MFFKRLSLMCDHYFDRLLFWLFIIIDRFFARKKKVSKENIEKILVLNLDHIGDVLLSTPALAFIKELWPSSCVIAAVTDLSKNVLRGNENVDVFITMSAPWLEQESAGFSFKSVKALFKWGFLLRKKRFQMVVDFREAESKNILLSRIASVPHRLGFGVSPREIEKLNTFHIFNVDKNRHKVFQKGLSIEKFSGKDFVPQRLSIKISEKDAKYAEEIWRRYNLESEKVICLHPESNKAISRWPLKNFARTILYLQKDLRVKVLLTGIDKNTDLFFRKADFDVISLVGETDIFQLASIIAKSDLVITNDTGPMHIAAAVHTPTVAVFSSAYNAEASVPFKTEFRIIVKKIGCNLCDEKGKVCTDYECLKSITPQEVFPVIKDFILTGYRGQEIIYV